LRKFRLNLFAQFRGRLDAVCLLRRGKIFRERENKNQGDGFETILQFHKNSCWPNLIGRRFQRNAETAARLTWRASVLAWRGVA
jgi:hypothetical protein